MNNTKIQQIQSKLQYLIKYKRQFEDAMYKNDNLSDIQGNINSINIQNIEINEPTLESNADPNSLQNTEIKSKINMEINMPYTKITES